MIIVLAALGALTAVALPPLRVTLAVVVIPLGAHLLWLERFGDCERYGLNPLAMLSKWAQERWFVTPPAPTDLTQAVARGHELLAALGQLK